ncbi:MAG TPA: hypothetical protein VMN76_04825 [Acidobacteriota bacterium]|nr:hypothetical protein [Acidobacteriota bacterium]
MPHEILARLELLVTEVTGQAANLRTQNSELRQRIRRLEEELEELNRKNQEVTLAVGKLRLDRKKIQSRVKRIQENIAVLEEPLKHAKG